MTDAPAPPALPTAGEVVAFWRDAGPAKWFAKDPDFDARFRARFLDAHMAAAARRLDGWLGDAEGALALMILLDQFPRNTYRGTAHMFATDPLARHFAGRAVRDGLDRQVPRELRIFFYLPFEHSESAQDQARCLELVQGLEAETVRYAVVHRDIIERFGRFPHRNAALGRDTTPEEQAFLDGGGFAG